MSCWAIVVAAGKGERFGSYKPLFKIEDKFMIEYSVETLSKSSKVDAIVVVALSNYIQFVRELLKGFDKVKYVVPGGTLRQDSVRKGLLKVPEDVEYVLIHDAARPFVSNDIVERSVEAAEMHGSCVVCIGVNDTVKRVEGDFIKETLDRKSIYLAQTPQVFKRIDLLNAFENASEKRQTFTDESSMIEALGINPFVISGDIANSKVTFREDLLLFERLFHIKESTANSLREESSETSRYNIFVGIGEDVHAFDKERPLYLGGVLIPYEKGLKGHSDADVLLHALIDALLGASGNDDIGTLFPDSDPKYKGISSIILLQNVRETLYRNGYRINNIDMIVCAENPKIRPYKKEIISTIARNLSVDERCINLKGKTFEGLGFVGKGEGIYAKAAVLLTKEGDA